MTEIIITDEEFVKKYIGRKIYFNYNDLKIDEVYRSFVILIDNNNNNKEITASITVIANIIKEELRVEEIANKGYDIEEYIKDNGILTNVFTTDRQPGYDFLRICVLKEAKSLKHSKKYISIDKGNGFKAEIISYNITTNPPGSQQKNNNNWVCYNASAEFRNESSSYLWAKKENGLFITNACVDPNKYNHSHIHFSDTRSEDWKKHTDMAIVYYKNMQDVYDIIRKETITRLSNEILPYIGDLVDYKKDVENGIEIYWFIDRVKETICILKIKIEAINELHERTKIEIVRFEQISPNIIKVAFSYKAKPIPKRCSKMKIEDVKEFLNTTFNEIVDRWILVSEKNKL